MPRRLISTGSPLEKTVGYSRAVIDGDFAFVAGTTGYDYATMTMPADVTSQSRNCFKTIEAALKEGGFAMADIVRATYYVTDAKHIDAHVAVTWLPPSANRKADPLDPVGDFVASGTVVEAGVTTRWSF